MCISVVYFSGPYLSNCQKLFCCLSYISTDMFGCLFYQLLRKEHQNLPLCWFTVPPGSCVIFPFVDFEAMLLSIMRIEFLYPLKKKKPLPFLSFHCDPLISNDTSTLPIYFTWYKMLNFDRTFPERFFFHYLITNFLSFYIAHTSPLNST